LKKTWKSTLPLLLVAALSFSFSVGCGNDNTSTPVSNGIVYAAVTNGGSTSLGTSNTLQLFHGVNNNGNGQNNAGPSASLSLSTTPQALALDVSRDRLYAGTITGTSTQLLVFNNASQIGNGSAAVVSVNIPGALVISESYDAARDVLFMGFQGGGVLRINNASALSQSTATVQPLLTAGLNAILDDSVNDRLIVAPATSATLPFFGAASSTVTFTQTGTLTPVGVTNPLDICFADGSLGANNRLFVLDAGVNNTFGGSTTQILRYDNATTGLATSPSLLINSAGAGGGICIAYDGGQDFLYEGRSNGTISVYEASAECNWISNRIDSLTHVKLDSR
jgi:hypothetical protein